MGMAASQVRFLSLQNRKNTIGRQLSTLSNRKTSLARDMKNVSRHYTDALNQTNLKWSNDSGANYHNLTYDMLMKPNEVNASVPYILTNANNGKVILNNSALYTPDTMFDDNPETLKTDKAIVIGGETIANAGDEISYITLAKMISSFKSVDDNGQPVYDTAGAYKTNSEGNLVGQAGIAKGYYIPDTVDFNFKNNLRYELFQILGLVTDEQVKTQNSLLVELYGSEEAKNTGVYPIGSAWGDYYLAQAQLEAYEEFLSNEHPYALGDTYGGTYYSTTVGGKGTDTRLTTANSANSIATDKNTIKDFSYSTEINGIDGSSTVTQETYKQNGAITHVDFNSVIDGSSGYYTVKDSTGANYTKYHKDLLGYSTDVSTGKIIGKYNTTDNLLNEALDGKTFTVGSDPYLWALSHRNEKTLCDGANHVPNADCSTDFTINSTNTDHGANVEYSSSVVFIGNWKKHSYFSEIKNDAKISNSLGNMCDSFYSLINSITSTDKFNKTSSNDACAEAAKSSTINYLIANCNKYEHKNGDNQKSFENSRAMAAASGHGLGSWGSDITGHRDHVAVAVDTAVAFDVYMTFFKNYQRGYEQTGTLPTPDALFVDTPHAEIVDNTDDSAIIDDKLSSTTHGGVDYLIYTQTGYKDDSGRAFAESQTYKLQTSMPTAGTDYITVYKQAAGNYTLASTGATGEQVMYAIPANEKFDYYCDASGNVASSTSNTFNGKSVFATVTTNTAYYYFTTKDAATKYRNGEITNLDTYTGTGVEKIARTVVSSSAENPPAFDTVPPYEIDLERDYINSKYDTYEDVLYKDNGFLEVLKQNVSDAQNRIKELEDSLENFYGDADKKIMDYYDALFLRISEQGWEEDNYTKNDLYLNNKIQNNDFFLTECLQKSSNTGFNYTAKQATNVIKIFTVHDDDAENEALAEYEAKKTEIQYKENVIDTRMTKLETEQESINTEMESIKKVRDENTQKYFKIFA